MFVIQPVRFPVMFPLNLAIWQFGPKMKEIQCLITGRRYFDVIVAYTLHVSTLLLLLRQLQKISDILGACIGIPTVCKKLRHNASVRLVFGSY